MPIPTWDEVKDQFHADAEGDMEYWRRKYETARNLSHARGDLADNSEGAGEFIARRSIPFVSSIYNAGNHATYQAARDRLNEGRPDHGDIAIVAEHERTQERDHQRGTLGQIGSGLAHLPAMLGEAYAGGAALRGLGMGVGATRSLMTPGGLLAGAGRNLATTATMPSIWLDPAAERASQQGGSTFDPQNIVPSAIMGFAQTAVLGSLGKFGNSIIGDGVAPFVKRLAARTFTGMAEQQGIDAIAGIVDEALPKDFKFGTGYGLAGGVKRAATGEGSWEDVGKHFSVQLATFAVFSALHPLLHGEQKPESSGVTPPVTPDGETPQVPRNQEVAAKETVAEVKQAGDDFVKREMEGGWTRKAAMEKGSVAIDTIQRALAENPSLTREQARDLFKGRNVNKNQRDFAEYLISKLPEAITEQTVAPKEPELPSGVTPAVTPETPTMPATDPASTGGQMATEPAQSAQEVAKGPTPEPPKPTLKERLASGERLTQDQMYEAAGLDAREKRILKERLGHEKRSLTSLGEEFGVTRERIRQIEAGAIEKLGGDKSVAEMNRIGAAEPTATKPDLLPDESAGSVKSEPVAPEVKKRLADADKILIDAGYGAKNPNDAKDTAKQREAINKSIADELTAMHSDIHPEDKTLDAAVERFRAQRKAQGFRGEGLQNMVDNFAHDSMQRELAQTKQELNNVNRGLTDAQNAEVSRVAAEVRKASGKDRGPQEAQEAAPAAGGAAEDSGPGSKPASASGAASGLGEAGRVEAQPIKKPGDIGPRHFATGVEPAEQNAKKQLPSGTTALANAVADKEAKAEGRAPMFGEAKKQFNVTTWNDAMAKIERDPQYAGRLVDDLLSRPRPLTDVGDTAVLLHRKISLINERRETNASLVAEKDLAKRKDLEDKLEQNLEQRLRLEKAVNITGTELARSFQFRRVLAKSDYELSGMLLGAEAAKKKPLTKEERGEIETLQKQIEALQDKLGEAEKKFNEPGGKEAWWKQRGETKAGETKWQQRLTNFKWEGMTTAERAWDLLKRIRVAELISSPVTVGKVGGSSVIQTVAPSLQNMMGSLLKMIPGIRSIANKAPLEGRGFDPSVEAAAIKAAGTVGLKDGWDTMRQGASELDIHFGDNTSPRTWLDWFGNLHAAEKAPAVRAMWERTYEGLRAEAKARGEVETPATLEAFGQQAYEKSKEAKFQQDNAVVTAIDKGIASLKRPENSLGARMIGHAADLLLPIRKTPTNIVIDAFEYALGLPIGAAKAATAHIRGIENLSAPEAESIMRMMKKGSIGIPLLMLGYFAANSLGGFYSGRRQEGEVKEGEIATPFGNLPAWVTAHHPAFMALQVGATARRAEEEVKRTGRQGLGTGVVKALGALIEEVPVVREQTEIARAFEGGVNMNALGRTSASFAVPALIQWIAKQTDRDESGPISRKAQGFVEQLEAATPGLRQNLAPKIQAVEDLHTEMSRLSAARTAHLQDSDQIGMRFPDERIFHYLTHVNQRIARFEHLIKGDTRFGRRPYRPGEAPSEAQIKELRQAQAQLASQALEAVRQYRNQR